MDIVEVLSSESEEPRHSSHSDGKETVNTESHKTKTIKKYYEPITEAGKTYKFQDNPAEYKRMRKKIQNRQSACRVRGRKKNAFENLEQEVEFLRKENSQLQLSNAKLETENKSLKEHLEFMKTLVKPNRNHDLVDDYLSDQALQRPSSPSLAAKSPSTIHQEEDSPMFEEFNWMRTDSQTSNIGWLGLAVFAIVLAVFVVPGDTSSNAVVAAFESKEEVQVSQYSWLLSLLYYGKVGFKYLLILSYAWVLFSKVHTFLRNRKLKSI